jgi:N-acetylneuraminate synthase
MSVLFVAEVSSNHNRDIERCFSFIDRAAAVGCAAVKFQLFRVDELFAPEILAKSESHRRRKAWELPVEFLPLLAERSRQRGLQFGCSPFYLEAVDQLLPHADFYKIASYELLWDELLVACAHTGKPVILSSGMATLQEVHRAVQVLRGAGCSQLTLLHCVSSYPAVSHECNLAAIDTLRRTCACDVGWSDHTVNAGVVARAVHRWGATMVEFHMDLDGTGEEFGTGHCWLPAQIQPVIAATQPGPEADGTGEKTPLPGELSDRSWRTDPRDGLRPLLETRLSWRN